jgi:hypothetical protein
VETRTKEGQPTVTNEEVDMEVEEATMKQDKNNNNRTLQIERYTPKSGKILNVNPGTI